MVKFSIMLPIWMIHTYSLIHDDLPCMDNDDFRRGKPSNHKVFGEANAVLAGDALLTYAPQLIIEKTEGLYMERLIRVLHEYTKFAGAYGLIAGQVVDIESESGNLVKSSEETLDFIHLNNYKKSLVQFIFTLIFPFPSL